MSTWRKVGYCLAVMIALASLQAAAAGLPAEYQRLKYVAAWTSGEPTKQYVKTGVIPTSGGKPSIEIKFEYLNAANETWLIGYYDNVSGMGTYLGMNQDVNDGNKLKFRYRVNQTMGYCASADVNVVHTFKLNTPEGTFFDGHELTSPALKDVTEPEDEESVRKLREYVLFDRAQVRIGSTPVSPYNGCSARIYSCKIWLDRELQRDFVPCRRLNGAVGFYDLVEGRFYTSDGSESLTGGPVAEETYYAFGAVAPTEWTSETDGPRPSVSLIDGTPLREGEDYALSWRRQTPFEGSVLVTGVGAHEGHNAQLPYDILPRALVG